MRWHFQIAVFFIAYSALLAGVSAQNVYRCGSSYSQTPCPNGVAVDAQDPRNAAQKSQAEAAAKVDAATANSMEKARLAEEAKTNAATRHTPPKTLPSSAGKPRGKEDLKDEPAKKSVAKKKKPPEYFTAQVAAPKKQKTASAVQ